MNNVMKFLNYNWIKIIKKNIRNNDIKKINKNEKKDLIDLVFKKEICALIFIVLNFLITFISFSPYRIQTTSLHPCTAHNTCR